MGGLLLDRHGVDVYPGAGGATAYQHLFWFYGHPVVYVMFFPFVGASLEVIATFSGRRMFGYKGVVLSLLAFAALSMAVWGHHMFTTGQVANHYFSLTSTMLAVPGGMEYVAAIGTLIGGALVLRTPMLFAIAFFLQFLLGGLSGIYVGSPPLDYHVHDSYFVVAHFHYTLLAGSVFGLFAAVYYWWPKVTGFHLRDGPGKLHLALFVVGTNLTFLPMFFLGYDGMPRRVANYAPADGWTTLNVLVDRRRVRHRALDRGLLPQRARVVAARRAGRAGPVGRPDARVGDELAAAATELRGAAAADPLVRAAARPARRARRRRRCREGSRRRAVDRRLDGVQRRAVGAAVRVHERPDDARGLLAGDALAAAGRSRSRCSRATPRPARAAAGERRLGACSRSRVAFARARRRARAVGRRCAGAALGVVGVVLLVMERSA